MSIAAPPLVSVDEYLNTSYEHDMEFVEGVLVERGILTPAHPCCKHLSPGTWGIFERSFLLVY